MKKRETLLNKTLKKIERKLNEIKILTLPADNYMNITALSNYSGISERKLKDLIQDPKYPLPAYKVKGSIRIKKSEFEEWISKFRLLPSDSMVVADDIISDVMKSFNNGN
jgi:hypothetical protein